MKVLYKGLYGTFLVAVLLLGALVVIPALPISGNVQVKIVKSGSMEPVLKTGSIVIDKPQATYHIGDIVTFGADTKAQVPTTHRIIAISGEGASAMITTKGDANNTPDASPSPMSSVHGKVIFTLPYLGYILSFARQPVGFVVLIGVPAILIILDESIAIWNEVQNLRARRRASRRLQEAPGRPPVLRVEPRERDVMNLLDLRRQNQ
jgi:signal peptidase